MNQDLGKFYSSNDVTQQYDEDSDRHYATLLHLYGDADEWAREQQQQKQKQSKELTKDTVNILPLQ